MFKRRANIRVENHTVTKWTALNAVFSSGTSETYLPDDIAPTQAVQFLGVQRSFSLFTGTVGVFTYSIHNGEDEHWKTLAVMWDVPFDYNIWRGNYWNVKVYGTQEKRATLALYNELWKSEGRPVKGEDNYEEFVTDSFRVKGCMTSNSNSRLIIKLYDNST